MKFISLAVALAFGFSAYAQQETQSTEAQTKLKIEDTKAKNKVEGDMDEVITNKKMRAEAGSKSRYSISSALTYNGGSIEKPLAEDRPNITGATGATAKASLGGSVGVGYRLTATQRLGLDIGVRWITPLESGSPKNYNGERFDASNPSVTYSNVFKWAGIQSSFSAGPTLYTATNLTKIGYVADLGLSLNNVYDIGDTGLGVGLMISTGYGIFNKDEFKDDQSDYYGGLYPFLEYTINDTFNLRTISGVYVYEHIRSSPNALTFSKNKIYQSFGLGISVARDIFLYPNIQFLPENMRADTTNVAVTANLNVF